MLLYNKPGGLILYFLLQLQKLFCILLQFYYLFYTLIVTYTYQTVSAGLLYFDILLIFLPSLEYLLLPMINLFHHEHSFLELYRCIIISIQLTSRNLV